ncbi:MAG: hypothetical protein ACOYMZ_01520, partial [Minisyncoccia bacterium]
MIAIPPDVRLLATLKTGSVYYFEEERLSSPEPHYFIVLNREPRVDTVLFLVCASSQVDKRKNAIQKLGFPEETLVIVSVGECDCFIKETAIDCNTVFERTTLSVIEKLENGKLRICSGVLPDEIIAKIVTGTLASCKVPQSSDTHSKLTINHL